MKTENQIQDKGANAFSEVIKVNTTLRSLHLGCKFSFLFTSKLLIFIVLIVGNSIRDEGAFALSSALRTNTTLTKLSLMRKILFGFSLDTSFSVWKRFSKTTENKISDCGARALSEAVKNNTTMTKLYLSGKHISNSKVDQTFKNSCVSSFRKQDC